MTYDWNKMVDITVPTGTNGWIYSGEVIINGVKVRFPVGVATTVPEPAAALLNKMIELEKEDTENTSKPNNHYVGSVTIPDGKTLTLAKGAKLVDENSAPVVILPETELSGSDGAFVLGTPLNADLEIGKTYDVVFNGTAYDLTAFDGDGMAVVGAQTAEDGIPFQFIQAPPEATAEEGVYGVCYVMDATPTSVTLSIVQTGGASADSGNAGGGLYVVKATEFAEPTIVNGKQTYTLTLDKGYAESVAALMAGKQAVVLDVAGLFGEGSFLRLPACAIVSDKLNFAMYSAGASYLCEYASDGTATLTLSVS